MLTAEQKNSLRVVLVSPRNPLNIGAVARAVSNFGFLNLRVVNPYDVAFREARSAVGGSPVLQSAQEFPTVADAIADCSFVIGTTTGRARDLLTTVERIDHSTQQISTALSRGNVALLFGCEKSGLSNDDLTHCNLLVHIPTREEHLSMNLGQAVAVVLYELIRESEHLPVASEATVTEPTASPAATAAEIQRLSDVMYEALVESEYVNPRTEVSSAEKLRRLLRRLSFNSEDAVLVTGMFRKILWKVRNPRP